MIVLFKLVLLATGNFLKLNMKRMKVGSNSFALIALWSSADRLSKEVLIKKQLRDIMSHADLGNLTSRMVRPNTGRGTVEPNGFCGRVWLGFAPPLQVLDDLTSRVDFDLKPYKKYIDNEILVTLAQMDRPSKIFDYLYLVGESMTFVFLLTRTAEIRPSLCLTNCQKSAFTRKSPWALDFLFVGSVEGDSWDLPPPPITIAWTRSLCRFRALNGTLPISKSCRKTSECCDLHTVWFCCQSAQVVVPPRHPVLSQLSHRSAPGFLSTCLSVWATSWMWPGRLTTSSRSPSLTWTSEFTMWKLPTCSLTGLTLTASSKPQGWFGLFVFIFAILWKTHSSENTIVKNNTYNYKGCPKSIFVIILDLKKMSFLESHWGIGTVF